MSATEMALFPRAGGLARLAAAVAGAMTFLAAIVVALAFTAVRTAEIWSDAFATGLTVELPHDVDPERSEAVRQRLSEMGAEARILDKGEIAELLEPWLGGETAVQDLPLPVLIAVDGGDLSVDAAREIAGAEVASVAVTDHSDWRDPVVVAADRIGSVALAAVIATALSGAGVVWLACTAAVAASRSVIDVLRLAGASDRFIVTRLARPLVRKIAIAACVGAVAAIAGLIVIRLAGPLGAITPGPVGAEWLGVVALPVLVTALAWGAARLSLARALSSSGPRPTLAKPGEST